MEGFFERKYPLGAIGAPRPSRTGPYRGGQHWQLSRRRPCVGCTRPALTAARRVGLCRDEVARQPTDLLAAVHTRRCGHADRAALGDGGPRARCRRGRRPASARCRPALSPSVGTVGPRARWAGRSGCRGDVTSGDACAVSRYSSRHPWVDWWRGRSERGRRAPGGGAPSGRARGAGSGASPAGPGREGGGGCAC